LSAFTPAYGLPEFPLVYRVPGPARVRLDPTGPTLRSNRPRWPPGVPISPSAFTPSHGATRLTPWAPAYQGARSATPQFADRDLPPPGPCLLVPRLGCPNLSSSSRACRSDVSCASACRLRPSVPPGSPWPILRPGAACEHSGLRLSARSRFVRACAPAPRLPSLPKTLGGSLVLVVGSTESSLLASPPRRCRLGVSTSSRFLGACAPPPRLSSEPTGTAWFAVAFGSRLGPSARRLPQRGRPRLSTGSRWCDPPPTKPVLLFKHPGEMSSTPRARSYLTSGIGL